MPARFRDVTALGEPGTRPRPCAASVTPTLGATLGCHHRLLMWVSSTTDTLCGVRLPAVEDSRRIVRTTPVGCEWRRHRLRLLLACVTFVYLQGGASAQSLRGSASSLNRQTAQAVQHDFTYLRGTAQLRRFVDAGLLVSVGGNRDYTLTDVSFPFARPAAKLFIERLAGQYWRACGERLVVTSLTRPRSHQPRNASRHSVHPTGMALDLRLPQGTCRHWLERTLLYLEGQAVLEATAERSPPHYHVAVFPGQYAAYVDRLTGGGAGPARPPSIYTVRRGDTVWAIARRHGTSTRALRRANGLASTRIFPGQTLSVPVDP